MTGPDDSPLVARRAIFLVSRRELRERLRSKSFALFTGALVVMIIALGVIVRFAGGDDADAVDIGVVAPVPDGFVEALGPIGELLEREVEVTTSASADAARTAVDDGELDVAVIGELRQILFADDIDREVHAIIDQAWTSAQVREAMLASGLSAEQAAEILAPEPLEVLTISDGDGTSGLAVLTGTLAAIMLFIAIQTFGGYVLIGVTEEKSSAVVELLLARVSADRLLAGKVIGIGIAALIQFGLAVLAGLASLVISGVDVPGEIWSALPLTLVWFLGGYALYSTLFALAGSLVSRQEDAQSAAAPISTVLIGTYLLVFIFGYVPESTASIVMSLIPPMAPLLMPMRMAAGAAALWEVALSLALLLVTIIAVWKLAARIYEQVLLQRGSRISWGNAMSLGRGKRPNA